MQVIIRISDYTLQHYALQYAKWTCPSQSLPSLSLISPDFPWWIFIFITFHTISVNGTIGFLLRPRACFPDLSLFVCTIRHLERRLCTETWPLGDWFAYWQKWHMLNFIVLFVFHISLSTPCLVWKYSFKIYWGLGLSVTMECLSISLPLSLTPARIILYSYIRLWEIPRELGIIKDGIYCFIMYIRAKAICTV